MADDHDDEVTGSFTHHGSFHWTTFQQATMGKKQQLYSNVSYPCEKHSNQHSNICFTVFLCQIVKGILG